MKVVVEGRLLLLSVTVVVRTVALVESTTVLMKVVRGEVTIVECDSSSKDSSTSRVRQ